MPQRGGEEGWRCLLFCHYRFPKLLADWNIRTVRIKFLTYDWYEYDRRTERPRGPRWMRWINHFMFFFIFRRVSLQAVVFDIQQTRMHHSQQIWRQLLSRRPDGNQRYLRKYAYLEFDKKISLCLFFGPTYYSHFYSFWQRLKSLRRSLMEINE